METSVYVSTLELEYMNRDRENISKYDYVCQATNY